MKKSLILTVLFFAFTLQFVSAHPENETQINLKKIFRKSLKLQGLMSKFSNRHREVVRVTFTIDEAGKINVLESLTTNEEIETQLMQELQDVVIDQDHDSEQVYYYDFKFYND